MKKFIIKSVLFLCVVIGVLTFVLLKYGGYVDYFYEKFTTPKSHSFILGDSRSLQGIQPEIINNYFKESDLELEVLNYSFTLKQIAYGAPYLESIKRKIDKTTKNGLFIISVHPFTLSSRNKNNEEDNGIFFEADMPPHNMKFVNTSPNYEYLIRNFDFFHFRGVFRQSSKTHKDGWLEETNLPKDTILLNTWKSNQIKLYGDFSKEWMPSETRIKYLIKTVVFLKKYGEVVIVRLPVDREIQMIENKYWNEFNNDLGNIANTSKAQYINFNTAQNQFKTYDGIHIDKFSGVEYTKALCDSIRKHIEYQKK
jgi:hypothetical protein